MPPIDDEDATPRRRRRAWEAPLDDDDDRPQRKKKSNSPTWIIFAILGVAGFGCLGVGGVLLGLMLPAVNKVREAANRTTDANNMRELGLAIHTYAASYNGKVHGPYYYDLTAKKSNNSLSYRVAMLPFIQHNQEFKQMDVQKSWDAEVNRAVWSRPLLTYQLPGDSSVGMTPYRSFVGGGAPFDENTPGFDIDRIPDGMMSTIFAIHAQDHVNWAKPEEFPYSPKSALPPLGETADRGFNTLFLDGHIQFIQKSVNESTLRALITANGNEDMGKLGDW